MQDKNLKLNFYTKAEIQAVLKLKGIKYKDLALRFGCSRTAIANAINDVGIIKSKRLNNDILELLQPELSRIHELRKK